MELPDKPAELNWREMLGPEIGWVTVCGFRPPGEQPCREDAKWHLWLAEEQGYAGACDAHLASATATLHVEDSHAWDRWCNLPGSVWMQEPPLSWCEQEHGDPLERLEKELVMSA